MWLWRIFGDAAETDMRRCGSDGKMGKKFPLLFLPHRRRCTGKAETTKINAKSRDGSIPKNVEIGVDSESILYNKESILFHDSLAKNGKKNSFSIPRIWIRPSPSQEHQGHCNGVHLYTTSGYKYRCDFVGMWNVELSRKSGVERNYGPPPPQDA